MKNSALFSLFSTLSSKEIKDFGLFLNSPYHNRQKEPIILLKHLIRNQSKKGDLIKEKIWSDIYPNKAYSDQKMRHHISSFKKLLESFLILEEHKKDTSHNQLKLISSFRKRGIHKLLERELVLAHKSIQSRMEKSSTFQMNAYSLYHEEYQYIHLNRRQGKMPLKEQIDHLSKYFILETLRKACILHTYLQINPGTEAIFLLPEICASIKKGKYEADFAIQLYYQLFQSILIPDEESHFLLAKNILTTKGEVFTQDELRDIYILIINYCIRKINQGFETYKAEALSLYQYGLENNTLLIDGILSAFTYKNIAVLGISTEDFEWVSDFLVTYKSYLDPDTRENTFRYTMAMVHYTRKEYDQAMDLLNTVSYSDVLNNLNARRMIMRIFYETGSLNSLDSAIDSFQAYIRRQKSIGAYKSSYQRLLYFMRKLVNTNMHDKSKAVLLRKEIESSDAFPEREWLLERI